MNGSIMGQLILKDWRLHRNQIFLSVIGGALGLAILQNHTEATMVVGSVFFFIALILVSAMLPLIGIVNERKNKNLAFLMSLPISPIQYTTAKLVSSLGMFLTPWLTLVAAAVLLIEVRRMFPAGVIPLMLILAMLPFIGFCITAGTGLVTESEGWGIAANVFCQTSYGLLWYFLSRVPALSHNLLNPAPVWNSTALEILGAELGLVVLLLGLTFYFQSRKRDFI